MLWCGWGGIYEITNQTHTATPLLTPEAWPYSVLESVDVAAGAGRGRLGAVVVAAVTVATATAAALDPHDAAGEAVSSWAVETQAHGAGLGGRAAPPVRT